MFRNDAQICKVNRILLGSLGLQGLWYSPTDRDPGGPSDLAVEYIEHGAPLSGGEMRLLRVAFDLWNGDGKIAFREVVHGFDEVRLGLVASLLLALNNGPNAVDEWIALNEKAGCR